MVRKGQWEVALGKKFVRGHIKHKLRLDDQDKTDAAEREEARDEEWAEAEVLAPNTTVVRPATVTRRRKQLQPKSAEERKAQLDRMERQRIKDANPFKGA